jgi:hypothetical protein
MADRKVQVEMWECFECDQEIEVRRMSHPDPEAPDFFTVPAGVFITCMVVDDDDDDVDPSLQEGEEQYVVCCSTKCASMMLDGYDPDK